MNIKMKTTRIILPLLAAILSLTSCNSYLEIVPDRVAKMEDLFNTKEDALNALAKIYWYLPSIDATHSSPFLLGDEYVCVWTDLNNNASNLIGQRIMQGLQSTSNPLFGLWSGTGNLKSLHYYVAFRHCDLFQQYIGLVYDMSAAEKAEMSAQVKFLKGYFAFELIKQYGPIVIPEYLESYETDQEKLYPKRATVDESFDFAIGLMKEAIPNLRDRTGVTDYGMVDKCVAKSILARVYLYRASPLFNGGADFMTDFKNSDGVNYFPTQKDPDKWKDALDAVDDAIATCESNGFALYEFNEPIWPKYDTDFIHVDTAKARAYYNVRYVVCAPWNRELIWGKSDLYGSGSNERISGATQIVLWESGRVPNDPYADNYEGEGNSPKNSTLTAGNFLAASYQMAERYYTNNGLPIEEDLSFPYYNRYSRTDIPADNDPFYKQYLGLLYPESKVINLYKNREMRFYANLIVSGGYFRSHRYRIATPMLPNTMGGRNDQAKDNYFCTGIGIQKMVHPQSGAEWSFWQVNYPFPFIRMADLYLMRAEALNEYKDDQASRDEAYKELNKVRSRAGVPNVETAWSSSLCRNRDKHKTQVGLRNIILQERSIEFAFEGSRYWDVVRYVNATTEFSKAIMGWDVNATNADDFFRLTPKQTRKFSLQNYLWPISIDELNINSNLDQAPLW
jgi:hypothetical protein